MKTNPAIDLSVPSPFGWVTAVQPSFDLSALVAFRNQLVSLQRAVETKSIEVGTNESEPVGVPVLVRQRT